MLLSKLYLFFTFRTWQSLLQKSEGKVEQSVSKWMFHFWNLFEEIERAVDSTQRQEKQGLP